MKSNFFAMIAAAVLLLGMGACTKEDKPTARDMSVLEQSLVGL